MELLIEIIMEVIGGILGNAVESPKTPKGLRIGIVCLLLGSVAVLFAVLTVSLASEGSAGAFLAAACGLVIVGLAAFSIVKISKQ